MANYKKVQLLFAVVLTLLVVTAVSYPFRATASLPAPVQQDGPGEPTPDDNYDGAPLPAPLPPEPAIPVQNSADDNYEGAPLPAPVPPEPAVPVQNPADDNYEGAPLPAPLPPEQVAPVQNLPDDNYEGKPSTVPVPPEQAIPPQDPAAFIPETVFFPATGDTVSVLNNPYWWHAGDYAQGTRTLTQNWITGVRYNLAITNNTLNGTGHVDLNLSINGIVVGSFTVLPGETAKTVGFSFPPINGPVYVIRLEETNTVDDGAGSISIPLDTSSLTLGNFFPATGDTVSVASNPYWWHAGDFAQGSRTLPLSQITVARYDLAISDNLLSGAGHVDFNLSINGIVVGSFTVLPGETAKTVSFFFPPIHGPTYVIRLEETNTVGPLLGSIVIPLDTSYIALGNFFPATGDTVSVVSNPYWWHDGDYAQGTRTLSLSKITGVRYDLAIANNVLNGAGHVDLNLSINGIVVGSFTVLPGETAKTVAFSFLPIHGPDYVIRLEETNTVGGGLGSIVIPLDTSAITFYYFGDFFPATGDTVSVLHDPYWWTTGDYAQGTRMLPLDHITGVRYHLVVSVNYLDSPGHVDLNLSINGIVVGSFTVLPGEAAKTVSFSFPPIHGPTYVIRLQETNTVDSGFGSIVIPLDTSTIEFETRTFLPLLIRSIEMPRGRSY